MWALLLSGLALALELPPGWTPSGPARALLVPGEPGRGELRELRVAGGRCAPDELGVLVAGLGREVLDLRPASEGRVDLVLADGRARGACLPADGGARWFVVLADAGHAAALDPDALLDLQLPAGDVRWGAAPAPVAAPGDPWGVEPEAAGWWGGEAHAGDPRLVGRWVGRAYVDGRPTRLELRLDADGRAVLVRGEGREAHRAEGSWAAGDGRLDLSLPGGGTGIPYVLTGGDTLTFEYLGARVSLGRQGERPR